jgi:predicted Abi (CAAX) family protease
LGALTAPPRAFKTAPHRAMISFNPDPKRPFLHTLLLGCVLVAFMALGAVVIYYATSGLWLVVHEWPH